MITKRQVLTGLGAVACGSVVKAPAVLAATTPLKLGMVVSSSGQSASNAAEFTGAVGAFMAKHGDEVAGRKVEIIQRDGMGPAPDVNLRLTQELITRQGVEMIFGYDYTPNVLAVKKLVTQAKMPTLIVNAATSGILKDAPYMVRFGLTTAQVTEPLARWMPGQGIKTAYALFANYGPGLEARSAFKQAFSAAGGSYLGEIPVPVSNPDFSAYVQRLKEAKPDAVFVFLPTGDQPISFLKTARDFDLAGSGIRIVGTGDINAEDTVGAIGDPVIGVTTAFGYSDAHPSPENQEFVRLFKAKAGAAARPNFHAATVWDVMEAIYKVVEQQNGKIDADATIKLLKGYTAVGPRGPITIDPDTRDVTATVYLRTAKRIGGEIVNEEFASFPNVQSPSDIIP